MIPNIAEYVDVDPQTDLLEELFALCNADFNTFGKTLWKSFSLESRDGEDTEYLKLFDPLLEIHRAVHPDMQKRSTGFNTSTSTKHDLFAHTDIDLDQEHPNYYNIVMPVFGDSVIEYFETNDDEIWLPELNAHGYAYYHEFYMRNKSGYKEFLQQRKIGEIVVDKPVLIDTNTMHRVVVTEAPRCAWVTRWINIPKEIDYQTFKCHVESLL